MKQVRFVALDTETCEGKAIVIASANEVRLVYRFMDFVAFLRDHLDKGRVVGRFVFYNLDYDATALMRHLKVDYVKALFLHNHWSNSVYKMFYAPGKYWRIKWREYTFHLYDAYPFFQTSLAAAAERFLQIRKKKVGKKVRLLTYESFTGRSRKYWMEYARQDAVVLQGLVDGLIPALRRIDYRKNHLISPGYVAKTLLYRRGLSFQPLVDRKIVSFIRKCYHGACVEIYQRGMFEHAWSYDVKSAYPYAMTQIPNMNNAEYWFSRKVESQWYFCRARIRMPEQEFYLIPVESDDGVVTFPRFQGQHAWITWMEADLLREEGCDVEVVEVLNFRPNLPNESFKRFIHELFSNRNLGGMEGLVYKGVLNSLYGISAETISSYRAVPLDQAMFNLEVEHSHIESDIQVIEASRRDPHVRYYWTGDCDCRTCWHFRDIKRRLPAYKPMVEHDGVFYRKVESIGRCQNLGIAALVTSYIRCHMYKLKRRVPSGKLLACFTDGIKTSVPLPNSMLSNGQLGGLGLEVDDKPLLLVGCGVYQHGDIVKLRGFHFKDSLVDLCKRQHRYRVLRVPSTTRITGLDFIHDTMLDFSELNRIIDGEKRLDINFDVKRQWPRLWRNAGEMLESGMQSKPLDY